MPVRARSRASRSSRKASQFCADAAQLVELGVEAGRDDAAVAQQHGGLVGDGGVRAARRSSGGLQRLVQRIEQARRRCGTRARSAGSACSVARRPASSRGRTWRSAMRAVMRSTSLTPRSASRSGAKPCASSASIASWRCAGLGARRAADASASGAARGCPCRCGRCPAATAAWARLAAQRLRQLEVAVRGGRQVEQLAGAFARSSVRTWASAWPWVCSAKPSSAAAAACAASGPAR